MPRHEPGRARDRARVAGGAGAGRRGRGPVGGRVSARAGLLAARRARPHARPGGRGARGRGLVVSAVKPAQQGSPLVLRCYNATDRQVAGAWRFGAGDLVKSAHRVRADERESVALVLEGRGQTVRFTAEPHEIVTILVT